MDMFRPSKVDMFSRPKGGGLLKLLQMKCETPHYVQSAGAHVAADRFMYEEDSHIPVPCGKCPACKKNRTHQWVFRLRQEDKVSISAYFVTLTYDTDSVPISPNGFMTLDKKDYQNYMKRLRKLHPKGRKIKYYAAGEYGSKNKRPHYHAIIFNADRQHIESAWSLDGDPIGGVHIGDVSSASVGYTAKYINKPIRIPEFKNDDRLPEFSLMSKGLGSSYVKPTTKRYHKSDLSRNYLTIEDGIKIPMPRYYRDKILSGEEKNKQRQIIEEEVMLQDQKARYEYEKENPGKDYDVFLGLQKEARYKKFYHFTNQNRSL